MTSNIVRALDDSPDSLLASLYDSSSGNYAAPYCDSRTRTTVAQLAQKKRLERQIERTGSQDMPRIPIAVLDTGMLSAHPFLRDRIVAQRDFTGEGPEDLNGHGTVVALLEVANDPSVVLMNVKVLDRDKVGSEEDLVGGIEWAAENGAVSIGLSLGIERDCDGTCLVCRAVKQVANAGIHVSIAAGNKPTGRFCPANCRGQETHTLTIGGVVLGQVSRIKVVGALDYSGTEKAEYSAPADVYGPGTVRLRWLSPSGKDK